MTKVLYLVETLGVGGTEQSLLEILPNLQTVSPVICHLFGASDLKSAFEAQGIPVLSLSLRQNAKFFHALPALNRIIREHRPQLIHTSLFHADIAGRLLANWHRIPVVNSLVSECYAPIRWQMLTTLGRWKLKSYQIVDYLTAGLATHYLANSKAVAQSQIRALKLNPAKVSVIFRGRSPERYRNNLNASQRQALKQSLGIPSQKRVITTVGRLVDSKGQADLLNALSALKKKFPELAGLLIGDGPERANLEALARRLGLEQDIVFAGTRNDVGNLLAISEIFAFPTYYEGLPGSLIEAMMAGKPIVATNIENNAEIITSGQNGLLVPIKAPAELADAIAWLLNHPAEAEQLANHAQQFAIATFSTSEIARQYDDFYSALA